MKMEIFPITPLAKKRFPPVLASTFSFCVSCKKALSQKRYKIRVILTKGMESSDFNEILDPQGTGSHQALFATSRFHTISVCHLESLHKTKQAISARERALCQLTVCFEFQSRSDRRKNHKSCALEMVFGRKLRR